MKLLALGDSLEMLADHRGKTPKKLNSDYSVEGIPVASAVMVKNGRLDVSSARRVSQSVYERWMNEPMRSGDVLLTSEAPLGRVARLVGDEPLVLGQRLFGLRGRQGILDSGFLYYALQSPAVQSDLQSRSSGSTVAGIRQSSLRQLLVPAPCYSEQILIADVLAALDDKIDVNLSLSKTVQALARSMHQRAHLAAGESGATGDAKQVIKYGDAALVGGGGTPSTSAEEYWSGNICWATPTEVTSLRGPYLEMTSRKISEAGLAACSSPLYPAGSILMTSRATIGAFAVTQRPMAVNQGFIVVQPHDERIKWWIFHEMQSRVDEFVSHANGATFLELSRGNFKQLPVQLADEATMHRFDDEAEALHAVARSALRENATLAAVRDALLPELMSGRMRVRDAEEQVEEVL